jgi:hypothetical protein
MITEIGPVLTAGRRITYVVGENNLNACSLAASIGLPILNQRRYSLEACNGFKKANFTERRSSIGIITINSEYLANKKRLAFIKKNKKMRSEKSQNNISFESEKLTLHKNNYHASSSKIKIIKDPSITIISKSAINVNIKNYTKIRRRSKCCIENIQHILLKRNFSI